MPIPRRKRTRRERARVREDVLETLREAIVSGVLLPGESLVVDELRGWLEAGSAAIREALVVLAAERLVVRRANRPAIVAPMTKADSLDLLRVYATLAQTAYVWGAPHLTELDIREMRATCRELAEAVRASELRAASDATMRLHAVIIRRAGSRQLYELLESRVNQIHRLIRLQYPDAYTPDSVRIHEGVVRAFEAGQTHLALTLLRQAWSGLRRGLAAIPEEDWDSGEGS
jgi:DNA-binding GntR family transcriptional regulator